MNIFVLKISGMLQYARILRQQREQKNEARHGQLSTRRISDHTSDQKSETATRSTTIKCTQTCTIDCGSTLLLLGILLLLIGTYSGTIVLIVLGPIFSVFGLIVILIGMVIVRKRLVSSGRKRSVVVLQKKKDTEIQGQQSDRLAAEKRKEMLQKPYIVVTEADITPVFDRTVQIQSDSSESSSINPAG